MNIMGWINAHQVALGCFVAALFAIGTAKKIIPKVRNKDRGSHARWAAFILYIIGGLTLCCAMIPLVRWVIGFGAGNIAGQFVSGATAVATLALGWHSIAMLTSAARDLADKTPDHEARSAALWVPTFLPIGGAAVFQLLQNPQGIGQGLTAALMGIVTLIYAFMIVKRADAAQEHKNKWNWFAFAVLLLAGLVIIPLIAYVDTALIAQLPPALRFLARLSIGLAGIGAVIAGVADIWVDRMPDKYARTAAVFGIGAVFVFGGIAITTITGGASDGAAMLNGVF